MPETKKIGKYSDLSDGQITSVSVDGAKVALYKIKDNVLATADMCTHDECSLEDFGKIVDGENVECTCHGAIFKIATGEVVRGPATVALRTYRVRVVDNDILIEL